MKLTEKELKGAIVRPCARCGMPINQIVAKGRSLVISPTKKYCDNLCRETRKKLP